MSVLAELWHIVKKDLRQSKWLVVPYLALVVAATLGAVSHETLLDGQLQWAAALVFLTGPLLAASFIQADSPTQPDAFWASHPFRRPVMLAAKLVLVTGLLLVLPLIGQLLGLIAFKVPGDEVRQIMLASAFAGGLALLLAVFLAALTRDLRSFILAAISLFIGSSAYAILASQAGWSRTGWMRPTLGLMGLAAMIALLVLLYVRRGTRGQRVLGAGALALVFLGNVSPSGDKPASTGSIPRSQATSAAAIVLELRDTSLFARGQADLRVSVVHGEPGVHYRLDDAHARFFLRDGATLDLAVSQYLGTSLAGAPLTLPGIDSLRAPDDPFLWSVTDVVPDLTDVQRRALMRGVDSAQVLATLVMLAPHLLETLPLKTGASVLRDGFRVTIDHVALESAPDVLTLGVFSVGSGLPEYDWMDVRDGLRAIIVNQRRSEGVVLAGGGADGNPGLLVLPGASVRQGTARFRAPRSGNRELLPMTPDWLRDARLVLVHWVPTGSYRISASSVPLPPRESGRQFRPVNETLELPSGVMRARR